MLEAALQVPDSRHHGALRESLAQDLARQFRDRLTLQSRPFPQRLAELLVGADRQRRTHVHSVLQEGLRGEGRRVLSPAASLQARTGSYQVVEPI